MRKTLWALSAALLVLGTGGLWAQAASRRTDLMGTAVIFQANVPGVSITVNATPHPGALPLIINFQPGTYALTARAPGFQDFTTTFTVVHGRAQTVNIVMQPLRPAMAEITFTSNAPNTILTFANSRLGRPLPQTVTAAPGTYPITAEAPGFQPLSTTITITGTTTIPLTLQAAQVQVTFTSNAPNTILTFANSRLGRPLPQTVTAAPGTYPITAEAPGFQPLSTTITITGTTTIPLTLQGASFPITFVSNAHNTRITVNGDRINLPLPQTVQLGVGIHQVVASAPGHQDSVMSFEVTGGAQTVNVILQPQVSQMRAHGVQVFINGVLQVGEVFDVPPGRHTVRVVAGNFSHELVHNFVPGRTYDITPSFTFTIR